MIRYSFYFLLFTFSFASCEKNISIKLDPTSTDLVVDASIENGRFPTVVLSRSLDYFSKIDIHVLAAHFVHGANVTISNGRVLARLKEDSMQNDSSALMLYFYTFNSADTGENIVGELNGRYDLRIEVENKLYTATTTIPTLAKFIDSLWWVPAPPGTDTGLVNVKARITDPPGLGNYTRYFTSVNNGSYYPGLTSVFDDQITDGTTYTVTVDQGVNRNASINVEDYSFFHKGDSVTVKLANIDKATYDFWRTMEYNYQSVGNPFSTPTEVISNVTNGALGYFGGYAAQYVHLKIPD